MCDASGYSWPRIQRNIALCKPLKMAKLAFFAQWSCGFDSELIPWRCQDLFPRSKTLDKWFGRSRIKRNCSCIICPFTSVNRCLCLKKQRDTHLDKKDFLLISYSPKQLKLKKSISSKKRNLTN